MQKPIIHNLKPGSKIPKLWHIIILGYVAFVTSFAVHIVTINLPAYAAQVGTGVSMISILITTYNAAEVVSKPIFGAIADRRDINYRT